MGEEWVILEPIGTCQGVSGIVLGDPVLDIVADQVHVELGSPEERVAANRVVQSRRSSNGNRCLTRRAPTSSNSNPYVVIVNVNTGATIKDLTPGNSGPESQDLQFSPDGKLLAVLENR